MTALIAVLGLLCLVGFCILWPPAALLIAGITLLLVAAVRRLNESRSKGGER